MIEDQLTTEELDRLAFALSEARLLERAIPPLSDAVPGLSISDAYAIAQRNVAVRVSAGAVVVGQKIGLTSKAVQAQLGVDEPDFGTLLDDMEIADGGTVASCHLIAPRVELELAFHLGRRLAGPGVTAADVRAATECVQPAIELVDSRIADWRIKLVDTIADAASSARFVLGGRKVALNEIDIMDINVDLWRGDDPLESGNSSAVLGDPCSAVAWLANAVATFGGALEPGHVVLSGACTRMVAALPGDHFVGRFGALGEISIDFSTTEASA